MTLDDRMRLGLAAHQAGRLDEARSVYEQVLSVDPQRPDALHYLGLLASQVGDFGPALQLMEQALALRPDLPQFHANLGNALRACGRRAEAVERYHAALKFNPASPTYRLNLGNALWELGQLDEALGSLQEAVRLAPNSAAVHNGLGLVYKDLGDFERAAADFGRALELNPQLANSYHNRAFCRFALGEFDLALADYDAEIAAQRVVVIEVAGEVSGYMIGWPEADAYFIDNIAVHPGCQGHGLGRRLIEHAAAEANRLGLPALRLYTNAQMAENLSMYAHLGFVETHRAIEDGFHRVHMRWTLPENPQPSASTAL